VRDVPPSPGGTENWAYSKTAQWAINHNSFLDSYTIWMRATMPMFRRYMMSPSSGFKRVGWWICVPKRNQGRGRHSEGLCLLCNSKSRSERLCTLGLTKGLSKRFSRPSVPIGPEKASIPSYFPSPPPPPLLFETNVTCTYFTNLQTLSLKMEAACNSETPATLPIFIWCNNPRISLTSINSYRESLRQ
jgi:hypothetical protein